MMELKKRETNDYNNFHKQGGKINWNVRMSDPNFCSKDIGGGGRYSMKSSG